MAFINMTPRFNCSNCDSEIENMEREVLVTSVPVGSLYYKKKEFSPSSCPNCKELIEHLQYNEDDFKFTIKNN